MIRGLFRFIFQLLIVVLLVFGLTALWIICDGLSDVGTYADVAVVPGQVNGESDEIGPIVQARLDKAIELYKANRFGSIVVSGLTLSTERDEAAAMAQYLTSHEVPESAVYVDHRGEKASEYVENLPGIMKQHKYHSVVLITTYYDITRLKMAFRHAGISDVQQAHSGKFQKGDAAPIAVEIIAFYNDVLNFYVVPAAQKAVKEAKTGQQKLDDATEDAKKNVDNKLNNLSK